MFDQLNKTYTDNNIHNGFYELSKREFGSIEDMQKYVTSFDYFKDPLCFGLSWETFSKPTYTLNLHWNFRWKPSTHLPATEFEEAPYDQSYLGRFANTGFLQTMAIATTSILELEFEQSDFRFELAYMPMNTK